MPKRALRRNAPDRSQQGASVHGRHPSDDRATRNNKYVLLEERDREERRQQRIEDWELSGQRGGPRPQWMPAASAGPAASGGWVSPGGSKRGGAGSRLRMTRVDGFNSTVGFSPRNSKDRPFAERACIPATEVIDVLEDLSGTLIFNTATSQERLALASRLRHWVVADGTYLIREGDGDRNRSAIFMIASGKATISLNRTIEGGSVQEVDIKDIKSPNYFGEGRVLGDSRAYASVRAKEELVVYYLMRADIEELVSPTTRALMERDMLVRKFQKEHLDDLFAVIRKNLSGMECLARFAEEQRMGGEVGFFIEVEAYQNAETSKDDEARKQHAQRIVASYISPSSSGVPGLIYTSEAQRNTLAAKMRRLWPKHKPRHENSSKPRSSEKEEGGGAAKVDPPVVHGGGFVGDGPADGEKGGGASLDDDRGVARLGRRTPAGADGDTLVGEGEGCGDVGGQVGRGAVSPDSCSGNAGDGGEGPGSQWSGSRDARTGSSSSSARWDSGRSDNGAGEVDGEMIDGAEDEEGRQGTDRTALSRSLFDEILDQNAIPTIRQNIVPKFIQSSYYEIFLAELFPQVETPDGNASDGNEFRLAHLKSDNTSVTLDESDGGQSRQYRTNSLEEVRDSPEALAARIAQAVAAARKVAEDAAVVASAAAAVAAEAEVAEGGRGKVMHLSVREPCQHPAGVAALNTEIRIETSENL
ncbi:unnamed protein product [Ectocarpus sp. 4 AP-2014]